MKAKKKSFDVTMTVTCAMDHEGVKCDLLKRDILSFFQFSNIEEGYGITISKIKSVESK